MIRTGFTGLAGPAALALMAAITPAKADAIDGQWCSADGRNMSIRGPDIVTPAGTHTRGDYARHFFSYTVPSNEPNGGSVIRMVLRNEQTVDINREGEGSKTETWTRCEPVSQMGSSIRLAGR